MVLQKNVEAALGGGQPARGGASWLPAWMGATEADPAHGHRSTGGAASAAGAALSKSAVSRLVRTPSSGCNWSFGGE